MLLQADQKKILNILKDLAPEKLDEVVDFAEYLKTRGKASQRATKGTHVLTLPTFHLGQIEKRALDRNALYGEHLDRKFD